MVLQARKGAIALDDDLEKSALLPTHNPDQMVDDEDHEGDKKRRRRPAPAFKLVIGNTLTLVLLLLLGAWVYYGTNSPSGSTRRFPFPKPPSPPLPPFIDEGIAKCEIISRPPPNFSPYDGRRQVSDRFVKGTKPVWLKNGTLWTGEDDGEEIRHGTDVLLERGVIRAIGSNKEILSSLRSRGLTAQGLDDYMKEVDEVELSGAWVTPGIVDLHSHLAVGPSPALSGAADGNSLKSPILPWLRSLDAFNTHDQAFNLSISGGITTMLVLPGSAGNIGGEYSLPGPPSLGLGMVGRMSTSVRLKLCCRPGIHFQAPLDGREHTSIDAGRASLCDAKWLLASHRSLETHQARLWRESASSLREHPFGFGV